MIELINVPSGCTRIWEVWLNSDSVEGRGTMYVHARFLNHDDALAEARGQGPMGSTNGSVRQAVIFDSRKSFVTWKDADLKQRTLKRLSAEEKRVLGL